MLVRLVVSVLLVLLAGAAWAQPDLPELKGLWQPVVGKGAVYQVKDSEKVLELSTAVVGEEEGGVWLEEVVTGEPGMLTVKVLVNHEGIQRLIVQPGEDGPVLELPPAGVPGKPGAPSAGNDQSVSKNGELIGPEVVTTPAGTFNTQHFRIDDTDVWVTADIPPLGVVKSTKGDLEITLVRVYENATSRITKEPRKLRPGD